MAAIFVMLGVSCAHADDTRDVNIYSFVTPSGEKLIPPTADHPATCLFISAGYKQEGDLAAGEKSPDPKKVEALVRKACAAAHYLGVKKDSRELNYIIIYYWGYLNPEVVTDDGDPDQPPTRFNDGAMTSLLAGDSFNRMMLNTMARQEVLTAADDDRYVVYISAYSPAAYMKKKEKKLLWRAQMSLASNGVNLDQSIQALVESSVNYLGRATDTPQQVNMDLDRSAHVDIGTPEVEEYIPAINLPNSAATPKKP